MRGPLPVRNLPAAPPECLVGSEIARQAQGGICRDRAFAVHDLVEAPRRNADITRQPIPADP